MNISPNYNTINPNRTNQIIAINNVVAINNLRGTRKSVSKKAETMCKVHGNNGNSNLKDDYNGAF
jgi:hypothetical protein